MTPIPGYGQRRAGQTIFKYCPIATSPGIELIREFILKYCSITAISIKTKPLLNIDPSSPPPPETTHYVNSFLIFDSITASNPANVQRREGETIFNFARALLPPAEAAQYVNSFLNIVGPS